MTKKIRINDVEYAVKPGMRSIIIFEKIREKPFEIKTTTDLLVYIYSSILSGAPEERIDLEFNDMLDAFDNDPKLLKEAIDIVLKRDALENVVQISNEGGPEPKKV